jgi:hypothetical protein
MLKQILSVSDVKKLKIGDRLSDHPDSSLGKTYMVGNVSCGLVYAIYDNGHVELKVFKTDEVPQMCWWVYIHDHSEHEPVRLKHL